MKLNNRITKAPVFVSLAAVLVMVRADAAVPLVEIPTLPQEGASAADFAPSGWSVETSVNGDLNRDGRSDIAMVLRMRDPNNIIRSGDEHAASFDSNPRILAVAIARPGGGYRLNSVSHRLIPRLESANQADPFGAEDRTLQIANGTLRIGLYLFMSAGGWEMGSSNYTFRMQGGTMRLIGFDRSTVIRNTGCTNAVSINFSTGRARLNAGHISLEGPGRESWVTLLSTTTAPTLAQIGNGLRYDPQGYSANFPIPCPETQQ